VSRQAGEAANPGVRLDVAARQRGIALVVVMWALVLLSTIAVATVAVHRTESALSDNLLTSLQGQAVGEAGVYYAIARLTAPPAQDADAIEEPWGADATPRAWSFAGRELRITVAGESGRIDLNAAPPGAPVAVDVQHRCAVVAQEEPVGRNMQDSRMLQAVTHDPFVENACDACHPGQPEGDGR